MWPLGSELLFFHFSIGEGHLFLWRRAEASPALRSPLGTPVRVAWAFRLPQRHADARPGQSCLCPLQSPLQHLLSPSVHTRPHQTRGSKACTLPLWKDSSGQLTGGISGFYSEVTVSPPMWHAGDWLWGRIPWKRRVKTRGAHSQSGHRHTRALECLGHSMLTTSWAWLPHSDSHQELCLAWLQLKTELEKQETFTFHFKNDDPLFSGQRERFKLQEAGSESTP